MRKLKPAMYVSLDGVVEGPVWTGLFWSDELGHTITDTGVAVLTYSAGTRSEGEQR